MTAIVPTGKQELERARGIGDGVPSTPTVPFLARSERSREAQGKTRNFGGRSTGPMGFSGSPLKRRLSNEASTMP